MTKCSLSHFFFWVFTFSEFLPYVPTYPVSWRNHKLESLHASLNSRSLALQNLLSLFLVLSSIFFCWNPVLVAQKPEKINQQPSTPKQLVCLCKAPFFFFRKNNDTKTDMSCNVMIAGECWEVLLRWIFSPGAISGSDDGALKKNMASWDEPRTFEPWRFNGFVRSIIVEGKNSMGES